MKEFLIDERSFYLRSAIFDDINVFFLSEYYSWTKWIFCVRWGLHKWNLRSAWIFTVGWYHKCYWLRHTHTFSFASEILSILMRYKIAREKTESQNINFKKERKINKTMLLSESIEHLTLCEWFDRGYGSRIGIQVGI